MGNYITNDDIYDTKIYDLSNKDIPSVTMDVYITDAEALVDGMLAKLYVVPFTDIPNMIKSITKDLSAYYACDYLWQQNNRNINRQCETRYTRALDLLKGIAEEEISLIHSSTVIEPRTDSDMQAKYTDIGPVVDLDDDLSWPDGRASGKLLDSISTRRSSES